MTSTRLFVSQTEGSAVLRSLTDHDPAFHLPDAAEQRKQIKEVVSKVDVLQHQLEACCWGVQDMKKQHASREASLEVSEASREESQRLLKEFKQTHLEELRMFNQRMRQAMEAKEAKEVKEDEREEELTRKQKQLRARLNDYKQRLQETETILARQFRDIGNFTLDLL
eukprot:763873-Hanusia_phi.AAC.2